MFRAEFLVPVIYSMAGRYLTRMSFIPNLLKSPLMPSRAREIGLSIEMRIVIINPGCHAPAERSK